MSKNKLSKFADLNTFPNTYQYDHLEKKGLVNHEGEVVDIKAKWRSEHFGNENPLFLELACGEGYYTLAMGETMPQINIIGVDVKGNRIWRGANDALNKCLDNVAFLRCRIEELDNFFEPNEVDEIWITFPDPHLKFRRRFKRITYSRFLQSYQRVLKPEGVVNFKTDSQELYEFTLEMLQRHNCEIITNNNDIYGTNGHDEPLLDIKTRYEQMHLANKLTIKYLKFRFPKEAITFDPKADREERNPNAEEEGETQKMRSIAGRSKRRI